MTTETRNVTSRDLAAHDLPSVTTIHMGAFPHSALTRLGREVVRRYYEWQLLGPHDVVALGAWQGPHLVGFCFGGTFRGATGGFVRKNRVFLTARILIRPWLAIDPMFRGRLSLGTHLLRVRSKPGPVPTTPSDPPVRSFGILSIAVDPQCQGLGIGKLLMMEAEGVALRKGFRSMNLTVHPTNHQAISFYERLGWARNLNDGSWSGSMCKALVPATNE